MSEQVFAAPVETVRKRKLEATQRLLGDTIGIGDREWRTPSLLPGWSRAHVAVHLARNADAFVRLTEAALEVRTVPMYPSAAERFIEIERGIDQTGLGLQIDLDITSGRLNKVWDRNAEWTRPVELLGQRVTLAQLPLARLHEVVLHHVDLDCGYSPTDLDPVPARWLLEWCLFRLEGRPGIPRLQVRSDSGVTATIGDTGEETFIRGTDARLWGWLTGRLPPNTVSGAEGLLMPMMS